MPEFKLIVAGGRNFINYPLLCKTLFTLSDCELHNHAITIVSGLARGADALGHRFALENNVVCDLFPADWNQFGKRAGFVRNEQMGNAAHGLLAFWDGNSRGTKHMIDYMRKHEKEVWVVNY